MPNPSRARRSGCPVCGKPVLQDFAPFCGRGCRDRDLLRWLGEDYRVAGARAGADGREIDTDGLDSDADSHL